MVMNVEQLKLILDSMAALGEGAKEAFIWWLFFDKALPVIGWMVTIAAITYAVKLFVSWGQRNSRFEELRSACGVNEYKDPDFELTIAKARAAVLGKDI